jgi:multisubunit Na+/H+ antiporter MnhF subunit
MFVVAMVAIVATMFLALARAVLGPSVFDRLMAVNMFGSSAGIPYTAEPINSALPR